MSVAKGDRVKIYKLTLEDVFGMLNWGKHDDLLFEDYNFPTLTEDEVKEWYEIKTRNKSKQCFSIKNEKNKVIGYLTIKNIRKISKQGTLGIVFDPNYLNMGYGTETIKSFLKYYFDNLNMKVMNLQVAKHNKRAIRCYEKCGFKKVRLYKQRLENQEIPIYNDEKYKDIREDFVIKNGVLYSYFYEMKIDIHSYKQCYPQKNRTYVHKPVDKWISRLIKVFNR
ncbi:GNAT family N-acetyltransferase [Caldisalinibacter kiritimatiensis]|uniref:GCN5-related N-acetyltransferase n=1 Tax=Caldisalinibacter kiritimatiensis TaxID=1304284 RepID=R1CTM1_9FIRM|nr:GNAT family N-acetyltransferase [Caldisalinibacter kiritimatiensis]EOD00024.1 GCN5-related N-acetyltransferase [Caldisalinibacter kiritimatiensis]